MSHAFITMPEVFLIKLAEFFFFLLPLVIFLTSGAGVILQLKYSFYVVRGGAEEVRDMDARRDLFLSQKFLSLLFFFLQGRYRE